MSGDPDWLLVRRIIRVVHASPGGGLHRLDLADAVHMPPYGRAFRDALMIAYKRGKIDFCGQYAVKPCQ